MTVIKYINDTLKEFLQKELRGDFKPDISFEQPKREWSTRIPRLTLNMFLYDIRENQKLRQAQPTWVTQTNPETGRPEQRRKPAHIDLHYLISAWGETTEDQHALISATLMVLLRYPVLPISQDSLLAVYLGESSAQIPLMVAQYEELTNPTDIWNVLDNEIRPSITCTLTVPFHVYSAESVQLVRTYQVRVEDMTAPVDGQKTAAEPAAPASSKQPGKSKTATPPVPAPPLPEGFWSFGGRLVSSQPVDFEKVKGVLNPVDGQAGSKSSHRVAETVSPFEKTLPQDRFVLKITKDGLFTIGWLRAGKYTLDITLADGSPRHFDIEIPSANQVFDIHTQKGSYDFQL